MKKLTTKQQRFVDAYDGNATEAARIAGYAKPNRQGPRLLSNVVIMSEIKEREGQKKESTIATREERQQFWTDVMRGQVEGSENLQHRLKAAELLGKSNCDFVEHKHHTVDSDIVVKVGND
jgi:phage terminase small subunit